MASVINFLTCGIVIPWSIHFHTLMTTLPNLLEEISIHCQLEILKCLRKTSIESCVFTLVNMTFSQCACITVPWVVSSITLKVETRINQFYRIIFFFLELQFHRVFTDAQDTYERWLPSNVIPVEIQRIVYNDDAYRDYLLNLRVKLEEIVISNPQLQIDIDRSFSRTRPLEEDLISLMRILIKNNIYVKVSTTTPDPTTPRQSKKKRSTGSNSKGKHFCKTCPDGEKCNWRTVTNVKI